MCPCAVTGGFNPEILREYDIRGEVGKNLSADDAYLLGRAFARLLEDEITHARQKTICVARDGRLSSPALYERLCEGLVQSGLRVIRIGLAPSPMLYFAVKHLGRDAGIIVTGSHNPANHNGFKMMLSGAPIFGSKIKILQDIACAGDFINGNGTLENIDISDDYINRLIQDLKIKKPVRVAWDAGNGAAGEMMRAISKRISGEHFLLYDDIDGRFPNHHPDPTVDKNLNDLRDVVLREKCDAGFAFDGDGDRIGVVDECGNILRCDTLLAIYAREVLSTHAGATIIGDVKCSQILYDEITRLGGIPVMWKTGHSLIKDKMREMNAPLAGELSGHIFFADHYYGFDDALYCAVRLLNAMEAEGKSLSAITASLPQIFNTPEIRFEVDEAEKFALVARAAENLAREQHNDVTLNTIDGLRVNTPDGWWLLRASNTQNVLVARMESPTRNGLARMIRMAASQIEKIGYTLPQ